MMNELVGVMLMTDMYGERNTVDKTICRKIAKKKYIYKRIDRRNGRPRLLFYTYTTRNTFTECRIFTETPIQVCAILNTQILGLEYRKQSIK